MIVVIVLQSLFGTAQDEMRPSDKDYKDKDQFERFYKRRVAIAAWQINQLREGALVVRLKTNELLIQSLLKQNQTNLALEKQLETAAINVNTMRAYINNYTFSKLYFIFSNSSDSLINGHRKNIFLEFFSKKFSQYSFHYITVKKIQKKFLSNFFRFFSEKPSL